jgi:hypothetical protein
MCSVISLQIKIYRNIISLVFYGGEILYHTIMQRFSKCGARPLGGVRFSGKVI